MHLNHSPNLLPSSSELAFICLVQIWNDMTYYLQLLGIYNIVLWLVTISFICNLDGIDLIVMFVEYIWSSDCAGIVCIYY